MIQLNWYKIFGVQIPDGSTVLPTDDIQIWLHCANIWDKSYTTLAEVLADTTTLSALISSNNAVDYLVRSTSFIYGVGTVPTMTSATTPSGTVGGSLTSTGHEAYKAFDGDDTTYALRSGASSGGVDYTYNQAENIKAMYVFNASSVSLNFTIYYKETAESANATASSTITIPSNSGKHIHTTSDNISGVLWGAYAATGSGTADLKVSTVQFYNAGIVMSSTAMSYIGLNNYCANKLLADATWTTAICNSTYFESVLNAKVPPMTDNTHPSGEAFASSVFNNASIWQPYHCFDNSGYDYGWYCASDINQAGQYAGYMFADIKKIYKAKIVYTNKNNNSVYKLRGKVSADGSYQDITSNQTKTYPLTKQTDTFIFTSPAEYKYFILYIVSGATYTSGYTPGLTLFEMQFYGREDV